MLDRTPTGRRRNKSVVQLHASTARELRRALLAYERLTDSAQVVHTTSFGVLVQYDAEAFDRLSAVLASLEDFEDGGDDEPTCGPTLVQPGVWADIEDGCRSDFEPSLGCGTDGDQTEWSRGVGDMDLERDTADDEPGLGAPEGYEFSALAIVDGDVRFSGTVIADHSQLRWAQGASDGREFEDEHAGDGEMRDGDNGESGDAPFDGHDQTTMTVTDTRVRGYHD